MTILIFILVLILLVLVHEFGHFLAAKLFGVKVEEFGIGFPPRLASVKKGETVYSLNALPLGGFVKIFGEGGEGKVDKRSYASRPAWQRAIILLAGVFFNVVLAFFIFWIGLTTGFPSATEGNAEGGTLSVVTTQIIEVAKGSPASEAGIKIGDSIVRIENKELRIKNDVTKVDDLLKFINENRGQKVILTIKRGVELSEKEVHVRENPPANEGAIGIALADIGIISYPWYIALIKAFEFTVQNMLLLFSAMFLLFKSFFISNDVINIGQISGPVGIAGMVGQFYNLGAPYLLSFIGIISINLAVLNVLPIPALDGGRLFFIFIEKIKGSPLRPETENKIHAIGFAFLIGLIVIITIKDIFHPSF